MKRVLKNSWLNYLNQNVFIGHKHLNPKKSAIQTLLFPNKQKKQKKTIVNSN